MHKLIDRRTFLAQSLMAATLPRVWGAEQEAIRPTGTAKKVIVMGAGLAGLAAAYELMQVGHDVTVLEARTRVGGRVYTLRGQFADDLYAEAGATNVFDNHDWTLKYAKLLGVMLDPAPPSTLAPIFHLRGKRIVLKPGSAVEWPLNLKLDEKGLSRSALWAKYVIPVLQEIGNPAAPDWPPATVKRYDQMSFAEFLRHQGASPDAVALLRLGLADQLGEGADATSALNLLCEAAPRAQMKQAFVIRSGSDALPRAFAAKLGERIHYGLPVVKIEHDARGVRVICQQAGVNQTFAADYLICAIPFSVLRRVAVTPGFTPEKQQTITQLGNTSVVRVFLQTRKRFWLDEGFSGAATTDLPMMTAYDKAHYLPGPRGLLEAYIAGERARRLTAMKESERLNFTLEQTAKVFPNLRQYYEGGASVCWDEDEWARGAYAWFKPGQMTALLPHIARPEGRVYFAGDHTSPWPGWMQGALQSGHRVAGEVNQST